MAIGLSLVTACGLEVSGTRATDVGAGVGPSADAGVLLDSSLPEACAAGLDASCQSVCDACGAPPPPDGAPPPPPPCAKATDCSTGFCSAGACAVAPSCKAIRDADASVQSGVYPILPLASDAGAPFSVYCDMASDGGGWLLAAKVHRHHQGFTVYDEPHDWWSSARDLDALLDVSAYENRMPGNASHGRARLGPAAAGARLARFNIVAENDPTLRPAWFKEVNADVWTWFADSVPQTPSTVCTDVAMIMNCSPGTILHQPGICLDATCLEGMNLDQHGYASASSTAWIHMRLNGDNQATESGLCSYTFNTAWPDTDDQHWGNGLIIWLQ